MDGWEIVGMELEEGLDGERKARASRKHLGGEEREERNIKGSH